MSERLIDGILLPWNSGHRFPGSFKAAWVPLSPTGAWPTPWHDRANWGSSPAPASIRCSCVACRMAIAAGTCGAVWSSSRSVVRRTRPCAATFAPRAGRGRAVQAAPLYCQVVAPARRELTMLAAFVEVFLAKAGHDAPVGINLLTKTQLLTLPTLYGVACWGRLRPDGRRHPARDPRGARPARWAPPGPAPIRRGGTRLPAPPNTSRSTPAHFVGDAAGTTGAAKFFPIVASSSLAMMLARKATGRVDGFVIEGPTAGGHNAPPRGGPRFNERRADLRRTRRGGPRENS